jgi:hypothetical protein
MARMIGRALAPVYRPSAQNVLDRLSSGESRYLVRAVGILDSLKAWFRSSPDMMRDRYSDREAGTDPKFDVKTPSGTVGPGSSTLEDSQGAGGAIEPDAPPDRG